MILTLIWVLLGLTVSFWLTLMFAWWRKEGVAAKTLESTTALDYWQKTARFARRGLYAAELTLKQAAFWSNKKFAALFFKLFPAAEQAFEKKDVLAGLKHGPSSYFLLTITEDQKKSRRRRTA